jgi:NAD(P)-dependent dehydrogenase (short-subunit alcohol dehydrogenase family)
MVEINLIGAMAWLSPVAEMFQNAKAGQIVGIGSVAGDRGRVGNPGYNTSKAALPYLEALRNRLTRHGVNVLTVKPGFVKTEMLKAAQGGTPFAIEPEKAADERRSTNWKPRLRVSNNRRQLQRTPRNRPPEISRQVSERNENEAGKKAPSPGTRNKNVP